MPNKTLIPLSLGAVLVLTAASFAQELPPLELNGVREQHLLIPMRDGTRLSAYVYLPAQEGKWPALFEQRYANVTGNATRKSSADLARRGFAVALVNFRGSQQSEGRYTGYRALGWGELQDGFDTCEWLATQPWCTGKVGSFGSSQGGFAQNFLAVTRPPHLVCQYMVDTGLSLFHEGYRIGGITRPARFADFGANCKNPEDNTALLRQWDAHPDYDAYWKEEDCSLHFAKMNVPCFTIGSWYDFMVQGSVLSYQGRQHLGDARSRGNQQLLLGPWLHGRLNKSHKVGDLVYPENAAWPELDHMVRWFDFWLKGTDTGIQNEPSVRYYVMGATGEEGAPGNVWRSAKDWPPQTKSTSLYLAKDGLLRTTEPDTDADSTPLPSDPLHPVEIAGRSFPGAKDARPVETQKDVRTWTTAPFKEPMEITGEVKAEIWIRTPVKDTDLILRVSDVYPDGRSILLMDYPIRARYREGFERQKLLVPNEPALLSWHVGWTSIAINKGHSLRVTLTSTGAPLYEPNPQNGEQQTVDWFKNTQSATHSILHEKTHASRLLLPVLKDQ